MTDTAKTTQQEFSKRNAKHNVRALVFPLQKQESIAEAVDAKAGKSKQLPEDPLESLIETGEVIEPPFELLTLSMLSEHSTELGQCVAAMEINIEGFGHRLIPRVNVGKPDLTDAEKKVVEQVKIERVKLDNFFAYAAFPDSFTKFRRKLRVDIEHTGNAYFEVIRNAAGKIQSFSHIPAYQMRLAKLEPEFQLVDVPMLQLQADGSIKIEKIKMHLRFRRFVQGRIIHRRDLSFAGGLALRWFKEFGDPRHYNCDDGALETEKNPVSIDKRANEIVHLKLYSTRSPYGIPRYVGNLLSIFGDRAAEEINYITFQNNNIPSMLLLISNGQLTQGSIDRIKDFVESQIQGQDNYSKFLLLEAESPDVEGEDAGQVKIDVKPLTSEQHKDALFQNYSKNNQDKIRRSFRLPPLLVGRTDEYTRATVEASRRMADEQIFAPERDDFDDFINLRIFPAMGITLHKFKSNSPNTTDNTELVKILGGSEKTGGMTPRIARIMLEDILGFELPPFPPDFPADRPFSETMAEAVKNKADPSEVGQQVTALKAIKMLTDSDLPLVDEEEMIERIVSMRDRLEKRWREEADLPHEHDEEEEI
jgi:capsid portal protein